MKASLLQICAVLFLCFLPSCGGGGGGGGEGSNDSDGVRVLHGALELAPLDIFVVGETETVQSVRFAGESFYRSIVKGPVSLQLTVRNRPSQVVRSIDFESSAGVRYTVFAAGSESSSAGLSVRLFTDDPGDIPDGEGALRFLHGTVGASSLLFRLSDGNSTTVPFGGVSQYRFLPAGIYQFTVVREADGRALGSGEVTIENGGAVSLVFSGDTEQFVTAQVYPDR